MIQSTDLPIGVALHCVLCRSATHRWVGRSDSLSYTWLIPNKFKQNIGRPVVTICLGIILQKLVLENNPTWSDACYLSEFSVSHLYRPNHAIWYFLDQNCTKNDRYWRETWRQNIETKIMHRVDLYKLKLEKSQIIMKIIL